VKSLGSLDEDATIYAAEPWTGASRSLVDHEPDSGGLPAEAVRLGLSYFLEVFVAREFLDGWERNLSQEPTDQEKCDRLVQYAIHDA
jgi:hypothetical protein